MKRTSFSHVLIASCFDVQTAKLFTWSKMHGVIRGNTGDFSLYIARKWICAIKCFWLQTHILPIEVFIELKLPVFGKKPWLETLQKYRKDAQLIDRRSTQTVSTWGRDLARRILGSIVFLKSWLQVYIIHGTGPLPGAGGSTAEADKQCLSVKCLRRAADLQQMFSK